MPMREINPLSGSAAQEAARKAIAANVRVELAKVNVSGAQMAAQIGLAQSTFARRMTGDTAFDGAELAAIAAVLNISTETLVAGVITVVEPAASAA